MAAFERSFTEAHQRQRDLGAIAIDAIGAISWGKTSEVLLAAYHDGQQMGDTLEMPKDKLADCHHGGLL
jgi:L-asparaginase